MFFPILLIFVSHVFFLLPNFSLLFVINLSFYVIYPKLGCFLSFRDRYICSAFLSLPSSFSGCLTGADGTGPGVDLPGFASLCALDIFNFAPWPFNLAYESWVSAPSHLIRHTGREIRKKKTKVNQKMMREETDLSNLGQEEEDENVGAEETTEG